MRFTMESGDDVARERGRRGRGGKEGWDGERKDMLRKEGTRPIQTSEEGKERGAGKRIRDAESSLEAILPKSMFPRTPSPAVTPGVIPAAFRKHTIEAAC